MAHLKDIVKDTETPRRVMEIERLVDQYDVLIAQAHGKFNSLLSRAKDEGFDAEAVVQLAGLDNHLKAASQMADYLGNYLAKNRAAIAN